MLGVNCRNLTIRFISFYGLQIQVEHAAGLCFLSSSGLEWWIVSHTQRGEQRVKFTTHIYISYIHIYIHIYTYIYIRIYVYIYGVQWGNPKLCTIFQIGEVSSFRQTDLYSYAIYIYDIGPTRDFGVADPKPCRLFTRKRLWRKQCLRGLEPVHFSQERRFWTFSGPKI